MSEKVWVKIDSSGHAIEIFDSHKLALESVTGYPNFALAQIDASVAKRSIRAQVYARQLGRCLMCDKALTLDQMHLHEKLARGKFDANGRSGNISLDNSVGLCYDDHINREHGNRKPQWSK